MEKITAFKKYRLKLILAAVLSACASLGAFGDSTILVTYRVFSGRPDPVFNFEHPDDVEAIRTLVTSIIKKTPAGRSSNCGKDHRNRGLGIIGALPVKSPIDSYIPEIDVCGEEVVHYAHGWNSPEVYIDKGANLENLIMKLGLLRNLKTDPRQSIFPMDFYDIAALIKPDISGQWQIAANWESGMPKDTITEIAGMFDPAVSNHEVKLFGLGKNGGLYLSSHNRRADGISHGMPWRRYEKQLGDIRFKHLAISGRSIILGSENNGVFRSDDGADTWRQMNAGLEKAVVSNLVLHCAVDDILIKDGHLLMLMGKKWIFMARPGQEKWSLIYENPEASLTAIALCGSTLFTATSHGEIFRNNFLGSTWKPVSPVHPKTHKTGLMEISSLVTLGKILYAVIPNDAIIHSNPFLVNGHVFKTMNLGAQWSDVTGDIPVAPSLSLAPAKDILFLNVNRTFISADSNNWPNGVYHSLDKGENWIYQNMQTSIPIFDKLHSDQTGVYGLTKSGKVYLYRLESLQAPPTERKLTVHGPDVDISILSLGTDMFELAINSRIKTLAKGWLTDVLGRKPQPLFTTVLSPGINRKSFHLSHSNRRGQLILLRIGGKYRIMPVTTGIKRR